MTRLMAAAPSTMLRAALSPVEGAAADHTSMLDLMAQSGWIGLVILLLSVVALFLVLQSAWTIRRSRLLPEDFLVKAYRALEQRHFTEVERLARADGSLAARFVSAAMAQRRLGHAEMLRALDETARRETLKLYQWVGYVALVGTIAPMLGLLGTVVGMIAAFMALGTAGAPTRELVSEGIYLALLTTAEGLTLAIPCVIAHAVFRNVVEGLSLEAVAVADRFIAPFRPTRTRHSAPRDRATADSSAAGTGEDR